MATKKEEEKLVSSLSGVSDNTLANLAKYQAGYQQGENVQRAYDEYNTLKSNAPGAYQSQYQAQLDDLYQKITNRGPFKYSLNGDMLYQNAKDQYQQMGKQAMVDTIGQATQLTGGYGNSYAQNVGNQAYQQWLTKLNDKIPEYYEMARQRYADEGDAMKDQYAMLNARESDAYNRYRDTVSDYNQNLSMAYNVYNNERDDDYGKYQDNLNYWQNMAGAENKDYWTQTQFDYQKEQDALDRAFREKQLAQEMAYKYAALAQSRANAAAREAEAKKKQEEEEAKKKQEMLEETGGKATQIHNGNGIGVHTVSLPGAFPGLAKAAEIAASRTKTDFIKAQAKPTLDLGGYGGPHADLSAIESKADKYQSNYSNENDFLSDLTDTLEWYFVHGNLSESQVKTIMKHYGLG